MADLPTPRAPRGSRVARSSWLLVVPAALAALASGCDEERSGGAPERDREWSGVAVAASSLPAAGGARDGSSAREVVAALREVTLAAAPRREGMPVLPGIEEVARRRALVGEAQLERFEREGGRLRPVLAKEALRGVAKPARIALPARASGAFEVVDAGSGATMRVALAGAADAEAEVEDGLVVYRSALGAADVVHRVTAEGTEDYVAFVEAPTAPVVTYTIELGEGVAGLRLVANTLELVDGEGAPRLRVAPPYVVDADGATHEATIAVDGCAVDTSPVAPWGRAVTAPGAASCEVHVSWDDAGVAYPAVLDPSWTTTGNMIAPRADGATATLLPGGRVLTLGGVPHVTTAELFDPASATWASTGVMSSARRWHSASSLPDGRVLVAGGYDGTNNLVGSEVYDPGAGTWSATGGLATARSYHAASTLADGRVLVMGGYSGGPTPTPTAEVYAPASGAWSSAGTMTTARQLHTATTLADGRVLVAGGETTGGYAQSAELYDPGTNAWTSGGTMPAPHAWHVAARLPDGRVLVAGGNGDSDGAVLYSPAAGAGSWAPAPDMTVPRRLTTATALLDGRVLLAGGASANDILASAEIFDPNSNTWAPTVSMSFARYAHSAVRLADGRVLVASGGINSLRWRNSRWPCTRCRWAHRARTPASTACAATARVAAARPTTARPAAWRPAAPPTARAAR